MRCMNAVSMTEVLALEAFRRSLAPLWGGVVARAEVSMLIDSLEWWRMGDGRSLGARRGQL